MHLVVNFLHLTALIDFFRAAPVILQVIESPVNVLLRILRLVSVTAFVTGASLRTRRRINSDFQSLSMNVIHESLHVGEFLIGPDPAPLIASALPAIIDVDVGVASVLHAIAGDGIGSRAHIIGGHFAGKMIPTIPTHGRSHRDAGINGACPKGGGNQKDKHEKCFHCASPPGRVCFRQVLEILPSPSPRTAAGRAILLDFKVVWWSYPQ